MNTDKEKSIKKNEKISLSNFWKLKAKREQKKQQNKKWVVTYREPNKFYSWHLIRDNRDQMQCHDTFKVLEKKCQLRILYQAKLHSKIKTK